MLHCLVMFLSVLLVGSTSLFAQDTQWSHVYPEINTEESPCLTGWIPVPLSPTSSEFFCVMTGEAKAWVDRETQERKLNGEVDEHEILEEGCDGEARCSGDQDWSLDERVKPVSVPQGNPWRAIRYEDALHKCQSLGEGYDLMSNQQWQIIARNIEHHILTTSKIPPEKFKQCIFQGNNGKDNTCGYYSKNFENSIKAFHTLTNGYRIAHFTGNVSEWVKDDVHPLGEMVPEYWFSVSKLSGPVKEKYGPKGNYLLCDDAGIFEGDTNGCGLGFIAFHKYDHMENLATARGGNSSSGVWTGIFATAFGEKHMRYYHTGFRCVYDPKKTSGR